MDKVFDINIHGLEDKSYEYEFEGSSSFFKAFEQDIIDTGNFRAKVLLEKTPNLIRLKFKINANIDLICDRSLEPFIDNYSFEENYIFKFGDKAEVISDELEVIPFGTTKINVSQLLYDYISLRVPIKKLQPKFRNEVGTDEEDGIMVYTDPNVEKEEVEKTPDPRWAALLKLKQ